MALRRVACERAQRGAEAAGADAGGVGRAKAPFWPHPDSNMAASKGPTAHSLMSRPATLNFSFPMQRILVAMTAQLAPTPLTDAQFHTLAGAVLSSVEATVDEWLQDDVVDIDTHRTGGLLELSFPNGSKLVLNTQPPLHELWLAARSGGYHYKHVNGRWLDTREGREFFEALSACASEQAGQELRFTAPK
jgi:CyaY protein